MPQIEEFPVIEEFPSAARESNGTDQYPLLTKLGITKERAAAFNKAKEAVTQYNPFAMRESTNEPPNLNTLLSKIPGMPPEPIGQASGIVAFPQEVLKAGTVENLALAAALPESVLTKLPTFARAALATYFAKQSAEQGGTALGHASVTGFPQIDVLEPVSTWEDFGKRKILSTTGGTTEQWRTLGEFVNSLLTGAGALGTAREAYTPKSGIEVGDIESTRRPSDLVQQEPRMEDRPVTRSSMENVPIVGQRPMIQEFPIVQPGEGTPSTEPLATGSEVSGPKEVPQAGQISFEGQGIPSAGQAAAMTPENVLKSPDQLTGKKLYSGLPITPEDIRPAIRWAGRLFVGERGDSHQDVIDRNGLPQSLDHFNPARGFAPKSATKPEEFLDRHQAEQATGIKGDAAAGGLDSQQLPGAAHAKLERMLAEHDQKPTNQQLRDRAGRGETQYFSGLPMGDEVDQAANTMRRKVDFYDELISKIKEVGNEKDKERLGELQQVRDSLVGNEGGRLYSGLPIPEAKETWDKMKQWFKPQVGHEENWTPVRPTDVMNKEILESKTATPIESKAAKISLPTEGDKTTITDRVLDTKNSFGKKVASVYDIVNKGDKMYSPMDVVFDMLDGGNAKFNGPLFRNIRWPLDFDFNAELNLRRQATDPVKNLVKQYNLKDKNGQRLSIYAMAQQGATDRLIANGIPKSYIDSVVRTISPREKAVYTAARAELDKLLPGVQQVAQDVPGLKETAKGLVETPGEGKGNFFDAYERQVKDIAHFVTSSKRVSEIKKIVRSDEFKAKYGDVGQKLVIEWLNSYAAQGRNINSLPQLDIFRKNIARGVLGFRVASQFVHLANVPLGMQRAGPGNYVRGLQAAMTSEGQAFLQKHFAETFERGGGELELLEKQGPVEKAAFSPQRALDRWNSQATALGVYLKEGGTLDKVNQRALAQARVETRRAVASPIYKDLPPALRTQAGKVLMQFQNTFMDQWSNIRYDLPEFLRNDPKKAMGLMVALAGMVLVESGIKYGAKKGAQAVTGYEPKHADEDTYWKKVGHEALRRLPGYGQLSSMFEYGSSGIPVLDTVKDFGKAVKTSITADDKAQRELAGVQAGTGTLQMLGVPGVGQASELVQNAIKAKEFKSHQQRIEEFSQEQGTDLKDFSQRVATEKAMKEQRVPMTEGQKLRSAEAAMKNMVERRQKVLDGLSKEDKAWLKSNQIEPPGFGDYISSQKTRVPFTKKENEFAIELYKTEYENVISFLRNDSGFKQLLDNDKKVVANEAFRDAAKRARESVKQVVESGQLVEEPKKKKRFSVFSPE